jgi:hypothetical protein
LSLILGFTGILFSTKAGLIQLAIKLDYCKALDFILGWPARDKFDDSLPDSKARACHEIAISPAQLVSQALKHRSTTVLRLLLREKQMKFPTSYLSIIGTLCSNLAGERVEKNLEFLSEVVIAASEQHPVSYGRILTQQFSRESGWLADAALSVGSPVLEMCLKPFVKLELERCALLINEESE